MITHIRKLIRQNRYPEAQELLKQIPATSIDWAQVRLWTLRCLAEQGLIGQASNLAQQYLQEASLLNDDVLVLWSRFILLLSNAERVTEEQWDDFNRISTAIFKSQHSSLLAKATAQDLSARSHLLRINLNRESPLKRPDVSEAIAQAANTYRAAGDVFEARASLSRQAGIYCTNPLANRELARRIWQEIRQEAQEDGDEIGVAEFQLALVEMDFEDYLQSPPAQRSPAHDQAHLNAFQNVVSLLEQAGSAYGEAKALWRFTRLLLLFGIEEGLELAHQILEILVQAEEITLCQEIWKQLATWHTYRGELTAAQEAQNQSWLLAQQMNFGLATGIDILVEADAAFRSGQIGKARQSLERVILETGSSALRYTYLFTLSVSAAAGGLTDEARNLLQQIVVELEPVSPNFLSAHAEFQLANLYGVENVTEAIGCLDRAYSLHADLGDRSGMGQVLAHKAWLQVQHRRKTQEQTLVSPDIEADFERAKKLLSDNYSLEGQLILGNLCQYRGQAAFFAGDWPGCGHWLELAEQVFRGVHLLPQVAFTLVHQALACIELGRSRGTELYDFAHSRLQEAQELFEQADIWSVSWQIWFYCGLCNMEAARWEESQSEEQHRRRTCAMEDFAQADLILTDLRGFASSGSSQERQSDAIVFNLDKQELYRQAFNLVWWEQRNAVAAFSWLEHMKSRVLLDSLSVTVPLAKTVVAHPLVRRERELWQQKSLTNNSAEAIALQREINSILEAMTLESDTADYAALRRAKPVNWQQLQEVLRQEQVWLGERRLVIAEFWCDAGQALLFGMRADWIEPEVVSLNLNLVELEHLIKFNFQDGGVRFMLEDQGEDPWQKFCSLIAPLENWARPGDVICLIPHGILHDLPLHTLRLGEDYLASRNPVFYSFSASVLAHTLKRNRPRVHDFSAKRVAVFGDSLDNLPQSRIEAKAIADRFGVRPSLGQEVTREAFLVALTQTNLLHFAGHGAASAADGFDNQLFLAGNSSLRAHDIFGVSCQTELVTLSGCETGLSQRQGGDELVGLVRAFFLAGVGSLLVSQWRVGDVATRHLLTTFYETLISGHSKAEALQQAMVASRHSAPERSFYYWGSFVLYGDWK